MNAVSPINPEIAEMKVCHLADILPGGGVCAAVADQQVAIFNVDNQLFAIDNYDPFSNANVLSRGIVGSLDDRLVVASPIYKQHFDLHTGECLEDEAVKLNCYAVRNDNGDVILSTTPISGAGE